MKLEFGDLQAKADAIAAAEAEASRRKTFDRRVTPAMRTLPRYPYARSAVAEVRQRWRASRRSRLN